MGIFMKKFYAVVFLAGFAFADISVSIDALSGEQKISPYIYGRNIDVISDAETLLVIKLSALLALVLSGLYISCTF